MKKVLPAVLFFLSVVALSVPALQQAFGFMKVKSLNGVLEADTTKLSNSWWDRSFQKKVEKYSKDSLSLHPACVRTRNQFEFSFFSKLNAHDFYYYDGVFYRMSNIQYSERQSFAGFSKIDSNVKSLRRFREELKKKGVPVYVVIAASKFRLFEDQLPWWNRTTSTNTNYLLYKERLKKAGIPVIDANTWFAAEKDKAKSALMSEHGVHWTLYGAALVYDSLIKSVGLEKEVDFQRMKLQFVSGKNTSENDNDAVRLSNLSFPPVDRKLREVVFPEITNPRRKMRPFVLADSFFGAVAWSSLNPQVIADKSVYYYYYNSRLGLREVIDGTASEAAIDADLGESDCFILMIDVQNLEQFGFGFIKDYLQKKKGF